MTPDQFKEKVKSGEVAEKLGLDGTNNPEGKTIDTTDYTVEKEANVEGREGELVDKVVEELAKANGKDSPEQQPNNKNSFGAEEKNIIKNIKPEEFKTTYWMDRISKLNDRDKINYLNTAVSRLGMIASSDEKKYGKKAEKIIASLQDSVKNIKEMKPEEQIENKKSEAGDKGATAIKDKEYLENILADYNNGKRITRNSKFAEVLERAGMDTKKLTAKQFIEKAQDVVGGKNLQKKEKIIKQEVPEKKIIKKETVESKEIPEYKSAEELSAEESDKNFEESKEKKDQPEKKDIPEYKFAEELDAEQKDKVAEEIKAKIKTEQNKNETKKLSPLEEFDKKIEAVKGEKNTYGEALSSGLSYERIRNLYLEELGWSIKYNFFHSKAWIVGREGAFINEQGESIKTKKEKRAEFNTHWKFPNTETPIIKFMREQLIKKFEGSVQG